MDECSYSLKNELIKLMSRKLLPLLTLRMNCLHIVVVQLQRRIATEALETHNVVCVVVDFGTNLAQRQIVRPNVVHHKDVALHLEIV